MSKKTDFIEFIENNVDFSNASEEVLIYWEALKVDESDKEKPALTDNGKLILKYMQENEGMQKSRDIAEGLFISTRSVAGACRKLVSDGFLDKNGQDPILYTITEKGKNFIIED